jgi:hypothetical protein
MSGEPSGAGAILYGLAGRGNGSDLDGRQDLMTDQTTTADERAAIWERRARALAAALDEIRRTLGTPLTESILEEAVEKAAYGRDDRLGCTWHLLRYGWPEDGFVSYPCVDDDGVEDGDVVLCPECVAEEEAA